MDCVTLIRFPDAAKPGVDSHNQEAAQPPMDLPHAKTRNAVNSSARTMNTAAVPNGIKFVRPPQMLPKSVAAAVAAANVVILILVHVLSQMVPPRAVTPNVAKQFARTTPFAVPLNGIKSVPMPYQEPVHKIEHLIHVAKNTFSLLSPKILSNSIIS